MVLVGEPSTFSRWVLWGSRTCFRCTRFGTRAPQVALEHYQYLKESLTDRWALALPLTLFLWLLQPFSEWMFGYESLMRNVSGLFSWLGLLILLHALHVAGFVTTWRKVS